MSRWQVPISLLLAVGLTMGNTPVEASTKTAVAVLETLAVKGRAPKTGYERSQFGPGQSRSIHKELGRDFFILDK